jgi:thiol:disulfide interchange protein DsbD
VRFFLNLLAAALFSVATAAQAAHTQAKLVLDAAAARPGDTVMAGIYLRMDPHWHTYWRNSGDSGKPTTIDWELPPGITAGPIQWPVPTKLPPDDLTTYVYENEVMLVVPLKLAPDLKPGTYNLKAAVSWLECEQMCIPGNANLTATLTAGDEAKSSPDAEFIGTWRKKLPQSADGLAAHAWWEKPAKAKSRPVIVEWTASGGAKEGDFFPDEGKGFNVEGPTERLPADPGKIRLRKVIKKYEGNDWPKEISGLLVQKSAGEQRGYEVRLPIDSSPGGGKAAATVSFSWTQLFSNLGLAFLGGLILNIMPCVLPVIALKIFSFVKQSGEEPVRGRKLSLIYALGILCSFLLMAAFLVAAQKAGDTVSWGIQMQNKSFVLGMTILVLLVALNLFGLFEVTLGGRAMNAAGTLSAKSGASGAFFNGIFTTTLAIPCTAPALSLAVAFAFAQQPAIIFLIFSFIALGLAAPYIVLTWNPKLLKFLPKPGAWMNRFKVALGFPMLATVIWLYKISLNHLSKSQSLWFGFFLVTLALAAWVWGEFVQRSGTRRGLAAAISLILVIASGSYAATRSEVLRWEPWSESAVEKARSAGRPVLVDFTADWCVTCQLNLHSIDGQKSREKLADTRAVTLVADYTLKNEDIARELHRFGRDAVPLVVVFPKRPEAEPIVLPPVLTPQIVQDALDRAAQ